MSEDYLQEVTLPSSGQFYDGRIPDGLVSIEPMGTREEKLFSTGASGGAVINRLFDSCVTVSIPHLDLVLGDRLFLLLQIRAISYGDEYTFPFRCSECRTKSWGSISIPKIPIRIPKEGSTSVFSVQLPILGNTLEMRLLTGKDEESIENYSKQFKRRRKNVGDVEYIYRLARRFESIDGNTIGIKEAMQFVEKLKGKDSLYLRDEIDDHDVGPELDVEPECGECGYANGPFSMPFESEFFRPRRRSSGASDDYASTVVPDNG